MLQVFTQIIRNRCFYQWAGGQLIENRIAEGLLC